MWSYVFWYCQYYAKCSSGSIDRALERWSSVIKRPPSTRPHCLSFLAVRICLFLRAKNVVVHRLLTGHNKNRERHADKCSNAITTLVSYRIWAMHLRLQDRLTSVSFGSDVPHLLHEADQHSTVAADMPVRHGMVGRGRRDSQTKAAASCRVRRGTRNCCKACAGLAVRRGQPILRCPIRSSVRTARFVARCVMLA